MKASTK